MERLLQRVFFHLVHVKNVNLHFIISLLMQWTWHETLISTEV